MLPGINAPVLIVTGGRGVGKTQFALELAAGLGGRGQGFAGIASPSRRNEDGFPWEIEAQSLGTGERRLLASRSRELGGPRITGRNPGLPPFSFSAESLGWALAALEAGLTGAPILIVDEIGPLELELKGGFRPLLDRLTQLAAARAPRPLAVLTVRPELASGLAETFPADLVRVLPLSPGRAAESVKEVLAFL